MPSDELDPLRAASKGLLYPSDTDAPFDVVSDPTIPAGTHAITLDAFFGELHAEKDAKRFAALQAAVEATLTDAKAYRVPGKEQIEVLILGKTRSGAIAGLHTTSVET